MSELKLSADQMTSIDPEKGLTSVQETLDKFIATADVNAVYGKPIKSGDMLIIPAAEVVCGMGFGMGFGYGTSSSAGEEAENENKADKYESTVSLSKIFRKQKLNRLSAILLRMNHIRIFLIIFQ